MDGDLSSVNPLLLQLSSNPEDWKQKRREALLKVFNGGGASASNAAQFMPTNSEETVADVAPSSGNNGCTLVGDEKFVLQQLTSMKRRRDERDVVMHPVESTPQTTVSHSGGEGISLKDRLKQKFASQQQS
jgi:hypothetical protein